MKAELIPFVYCIFTGAVYVTNIAKEARKGDGAGAVICAGLAAAALISAWIVL